jgi:hypothetical protein
VRCRIPAIEARRASEECALIGLERRFLADHASVVPASGFYVANSRANFPDSL